jgi:hypothetical protein
VGTSHAAPSPNTVKWGAVIGSLKNPERTASTVLRATVSATLPLLPVGYATVPAVYAAFECFKFVNAVQEKGLEEAVKKEALQLSAKYLVPSISNGLWNLVRSKLDPEFINTPFGKLAEVAFKKTMNAILSKGVRALEERQTDLGPEENIKKFMQKYGREGFLGLYFENYLFELVEYYLHSKGKEGEDSGYLYYVDFSSGRVRTPQEIERFRIDLRKACTEQSTPIVLKIKEIGLVELLGKDPSIDPKAAREIAELIDEILKELAREGL